MKFRLIVIQEKVCQKRGAIGSHMNSDALFENHVSTSKVYIVNQKLQEINTFGEIYCKRIIADERARGPCGRLVVNGYDIFTAMVCFFTHLIECFLEITVRN